MIISNLKSTLQVLDEAKQLAASCIKEVLSIKFSSTKNNCVRSVYVKLRPISKLSNKIPILCEQIMAEAETLPNVTITDPLLLPNDGDQNHSILARAESR